MEKTKEALITLLDTGNKVISSIADDGKIDFGEGINIAMKGIGLVRVFKDIPEIKEELKNITPEQGQELVVIFKEKFDLPNDEAEMKVEQGLEVLSKLAIMVFSQKD